MFNRNSLKEKILFRSGITKGLYKDFVNSLNVRTSTYANQPFVFVDSEDNLIRLLSETFENSNAEYMAFSLASHGDIEVITTKE